MPGLRLRLWGAGLLLVAVSAGPMESAQLHESEVSRAARVFRMQTYQNFRHDRPEYDRRTRLARKLVDEWHARGRAPWEARILIDWLQRATTSMGLPPRPLIPEESSNPTPGVILDAMPDIPAHQPQSSLFGESHLGPEQFPRDTRSNEELAAKPNTESMSDGPRDSFQPTVTPLLRQPVTGELLAVRPAPALPLEVPTIVDDPGEGQQDGVIHRTMVADPYEELPRTGRNGVGGQGLEVSVDVATRTGPVRASGDTRVNLDVLAARIAGFNLALDSVHDQLARNSRLDYPQLEAMLNELQRLRTHRDLSRLYVRFLEPYQRLGMPALRPIQPVLKLLEQRVSDAMTQRRGESRERPAEKTRALETLQEVLKKASKWTEGS